MDDTLQENLKDLPPSAKLVFKVLEEEGAMTQKELADASLLPTRTTRYAVSRLEAVGLVEENVNFRDARQKLYDLCDEPGGVEPELAVTDTNG